MADTNSFGWIQFDATCRRNVQISELLSQAETLGLKFSPTNSAISHLPVYDQYTISTNKVGICEWSGEFWLILHGNAQDERELKLTFVIKGAPPETQQKFDRLVNRAFTVLCKCKPTKGLKIGTGYGSLNRSGITAQLVHHSPLKSFFKDDMVEKIFVLLSQFALMVGVSNANGKALEPAFKIAFFSSLGGVAILLILAAYRQYVKDVERVTVRMKL